MKKHDALCRVLQDWNLEAMPDEETPFSSVFYWFSWRCVLKQTASDCINSKWSGQASRATVVIKGCILRQAASWETTWKQNTATSSMKQVSQSPSSSPHHSWRKGGGAHFRFIGLRATQLYKHSKCYRWGWASGGTVCLTHVPFPKVLNAK